MNGKAVYIHAAAEGAYLGNGGFICLNELSRQLVHAGYRVKWFDHADRLRADMWKWTGYPAPQIAFFDTVLRDDAPVVTTWLHSWLGVVLRHFELWPRLRYWCSGELLRADAQYDPVRTFVSHHLREIAINNPTLSDAYRRLDIGPRWHWTNWVRDEFMPGPTRQPGTIGIQPDGKDDEARAVLVEHFGSNAVIPCVGTQADVISAMQRCDLFLSWNNLWTLTCGDGESFGLNLYEAMACGCVAVSRYHCGNDLAANIVTRAHTLDDAVRCLMDYQNDEVFRGTAHNRQSTFIEHRYRFDEQRLRAIEGYLNG